jgi:hypothetical protein
MRHHVCAWGATRATSEPSAAMPATIIAGTARIGSRLASAMGCAGTKNVMATNITWDEMNAAQMRGRGVAGGVVDIRGAYRRAERPWRTTRGYAAAMDTSVPLSPAPPVRRDVVIASLVALVVCVGAALVAVLGYDAGGAAADPGDAERAVVAGQAAATAATMAWDALFGAWVPAAAVVLTGAWAGAPSRPLHHVFLALWLPYAATSVAIQIGISCIVPGVFMALLALVFFDPVAVRVGRAGGRRLWLLGGLFLVWMLLAAVWHVGIWFRLAQQGNWAEGAGQMAYQLLTFGCWLAWCAIVRRTPVSA